MPQGSRWPTAGSGRRSAALARVRAMLSVHDRPRRRGDRRVRRRPRCSASSRTAATGSGGAFVSHALVLAQTLLIAQAAVGLLLLSDGRRAPEKLHYTYGALALGLALTPWFYAPGIGPRRLLWFAGDDTRRRGARRSRFHVGLMRRLWDRIPPLARGFGIVAAHRARRRRALARAGRRDGRRDPADRVLPRDRVLSLPRLAGAARRPRGVVGLEPQALLRGDRARGRRHRARDRLRLPGGVATRSRSSSCSVACAYVLVRVWRLEHRY